MNKTKKIKSEEISTPEKKLGLGEHLLAMRRTVVMITIAIFSSFIAIFYLLSQPLVDFILQPVVARGVAVISIRVSESLMMRMKTCLVASIVISMPFIIWQIWRFAGPALYPSEKKIVRALFILMVIMFTVGIVFSYVTVFPLAIDLFYEASEGVATPMWSVEGYFNFVLSFILPFGLMFEMPVVIYVLARKGMVTSEALSKNRKYFILGASVVAAVLTPPDVVSQTLLLLPLLLLYEISVMISKTVKVSNKEPLAMQEQ